MNGISGLIKETPGVSFVPSAMRIYSKKKKETAISEVSPHLISSILKEISPECSLKGLILKLKLQYFGHLKD